jgi:soluble lytic murein transglycosylase-like protein
MNQLGTQLYRSPSRRWLAQILCATAFGIAAMTPWAQASATSVDWTEGCLPFIAPAEQYYHLPPGLLMAVALTESGQDGAPYPWALNIAGQTVIAPSYRAAADLLRTTDGSPRRDVAIGCMQIHMHYHLDRFIEPEWALHPRYNVWYAALYLDALRRQYGNMTSAIAHYHGSDPAAQRDYLCRVSAHLARIAPTTRDALGLGTCAQVKIVGRSVAPPGAPALSRRRAAAALMAERRVGRIIVLGADRP